MAMQHESLTEVETQNQMANSVDSSADVLNGDITFNFIIFAVIGIVISFGLSILFIVK